MLDNSRGETTAAFEAPAEHIDRGPVNVISRSGLAPTADLQLLLHRRLRSLCLIFALLYIVAVALNIILIQRDKWALNEWCGVAAAAVIVALAVMIWLRHSLSLGKLRAIELILLATLATRLVFRWYGGFWGADAEQFIRLWRETGRQEILVRQLTLSAYYITMFAAVFVLAYGVFIPNTWRRCVLVVGALWLLPVALWIIGCVGRHLPPDLWFKPQVPSAFVMLTFAAALAVFGSHRIETLRTAVAQARRLGQYVIRKPLGGGGMGEVYLADHVLLRRPCALKLIRPERAGDPAMLERFEREVQATATLTHPNAVQIFDYGHTRDGTFYYVMEYLPGLSLEQLVEQYGPLPPGRAIHFLRQLCGALREAHAIGLIHRDIKPGNVMICERGGMADVAKLLDFGLVQTNRTKAHDDRLTRAGALLGTPTYMSPEQAGSGEAVDGRSDIYSLGVLAYFLLTGEPAFVAPSPIKVLAAHMNEAPPSLSTRRRDIPPDLDVVILKCLAKKPAERFDDVRSLDEALARCRGIEFWTESDALAWWRERPAAPAEVLADTAETVARIH